MAHLVQSQMLFEFERFAAHVALEIPFGHVDGMMLPQNGQLRETLAALLARVLLLILVGDANVSIQVRLIRVPFLAHVAFVRLQSFVNFFMVLHVVSLLEPAAACRALVSFFAVRFLMLVQFGVRIERLFAGVALEGSLTSRAVRLCFAECTLAIGHRRGCGGGRYRRFIDIFVHRFVAIVSNVIYCRQMLATRCIALVIETPKHCVRFVFGHFIVRLFVIHLQYFFVFGAIICVGVVSCVQIHNLFGDILIFHRFTMVHLNQMIDRIEFLMLFVQRAIIDFDFLDRGIRPGTK